ncbi:hypothetical protein Hanom_Chr01g00019661 [Helianthus anomalus]
MFVHLTKRTKFLVCVRLFIRRTNTNELPAKHFTNCSANVWFVCNPTHTDGAQPGFQPSPFTHYKKMKLMQPQ